MSEDDIIIDSKEETETITVQPRKGTGFGTVLVMSVLAALAGMAGGVVISKGIDIDVPSAEDNAAVTALQAEVKSLQTQVKHLSNVKIKPASVDLAPLEDRLKILEERPILTEDGAVIDAKLLNRLEALEQIAPVDLTDIETRLVDLENNKPAQPSESAAVDISDIEGRLKALETASSDHTPDTDIIARIEALENAEPNSPDMSSIETRLAVLETPSEPVDLSGIEARIDALEARNQTLMAALPVPPFPRDAVLAAMAQDSGSNKGWIGRTLSKHVRVSDEGSLVLVEAIESDLAADDLDSALARARELPDNGRAAAQEWIDAVSKLKALP